MKIVLDAGHGAGKASNRGSLIGNEGDNNYHFSLVLKSELEKYQDVKVILTRPKITDNPDLTTRNKVGQETDLFLSLHSNAYNGKAHGFVLYDSLEKPNRSLATKLASEISKHFRLNRGVQYKHYPNRPKLDYYAVLRGNGSKSSMLLEYGFHDNLIDIKVYVNQRPQLAKTTADVIAKHYGLKLKAQPSKAVTAPYGKIYRVVVGSYKERANAERIQQILKEKGFNSFLSLVDYAEPMKK